MYITTKLDFTVKPKFCQAVCKKRIDKIARKPNKTKNFAKILVDNTIKANYNVFCKEVMKQ